jgi:hypothetical protein
VDKRTAQFESTGFQDPQAAATSGYYYYSYDGKSELVVASRGKEGGGKLKGGGNFLKLYIKFFGGKNFCATRVVSNKLLLAKNFEMWVVHIKNIGV